MCRLAFIPARAKISRKNLLKFFRSLEGSFGGDGNGYAAVSPDGRVVISKGVKLSCERIASEVSALKNQGWSIYFHTRKISIGWSSDEQCHPFEINGESFNGTLCHNGTWSDGGTLAKYLGTGSDTATLAYLIGELGLEDLKKRELMPKSGVFLLYGGGPNETKTHKVLNVGGSLEYCPKTGVWASEFFKEWPHWSETYHVAVGAHMLEKPAPKRAYVSSQSKGTTTYYNYGNNYGGYSKKPTSDDRERLDQYWKDQGYADALEEAKEYRGNEEDWGDRLFYHT